MTPRAALIASGIASGVASGLVIACDADPADACPGWTALHDNRCVLREWTISGPDDALSEPGAREVQLAVGVDDEALVAWADADLEHGHVVLAQSTGTSLGAEWDLMPLVGAQGVGLEPALALGPNGEALVAWKQQDTASAIYLATRDRDRHWRLPESPISWGDTAYEPRVEFGGDGEAFVLWNQWTGANFGVALAQRSVGAPDFAVPADNDALLSAAVNYANAPRLAVGTEGEALIAWYQAPVADLMVFVSERRGSDAAFGRAAADDFISAPGGPVDSHAEANAWPALHSSGAAAVVWTQQQRGPWEIAVYLARRDPDGTWHRPASRDDTLSEPGGFARCPTAAFTPDGALVVTWYETRDGDTAVFVQHGDAQAVEPLRLSANAVEAVHPALAIDDGGNAIVVWAENDQSAPDTWRVVARRYQSQEQRWLEAETISTPQAGLAPTPVLDVSPTTGAVMAAWAQGGVTDGRVHVSVLR